MLVSRGKKVCNKWNRDEDEGHNSPQALLPLIFNDNFQSNWVKAVQSHLMKIGLSPQVLLSYQINVARKLVKQRIEDIEYVAECPCHSCPSYGAQAQDPMIGQEGQS